MSEEQQPQPPLKTSSPAVEANVSKCEFTVTVSGSWIHLNGALVDLTVISQSDMEPIHQVINNLEEFFLENPCKHVLLCATDVPNSICSWLVSRLNNLPDVEICAVAIEAGEFLIVYCISFVPSAPLEGTLAYLNGTGWCLLPCPITV